jgi:hydrogenase maturation protease
MSRPALAIIGVGNILEKDDGIAVYAAAYLQQNYTVDPAIEILNGGVEGINLLTIFLEYERILILDTVNIDDKPGSIYHIPSGELTGYGINSGGAHEVGILQCIDMVELMGKPLPYSSVLGIVPASIEVKIGLSEILHQAFDTYIETAVEIVRAGGYMMERRKNGPSLEKIIAAFSMPAQE